jgi:DNA repair protein RadA/Sms
VRADAVVMGEVGLTGEVRAVSALGARLKEAAALGFTTAIVPQHNLTAASTYPLEVQGVESVEGAVRALLES